MNEPQIDRVALAIQSFPLVVILVFTGWGLALAVIHACKAAIRRLRRAP